MEPLYMIQCTLDSKALMTFAREQGLDPGRDELDLGYLGHAWLKAAFGELAPRPWRLLMPQRPTSHQPSRILAYSDHPGEALADHLARFATPSVAAVCPPEAVLGKALPQEWPAGRRYAFEALCCPVGRKAGSGQEKDVFLIEADHAPQAQLKRAEVYQSWFRRQTEGQEGRVRVEEVALEGFRLAKILRKTQDSPRTSHHRVRPQAQFRGVLRTEDGSGLMALLRRGIGRHRAFGFGMLLLRPA
ncbi:type I-E CRISPR-associated protein Cas6/Cse3/CasE [Inmirania thermothiophila]|uniref:CRISPR system Cascade subunit CasE n=1 Tax=Inmirania thermothiophila TaxID=1750597 RepID=A0A3N1Y1J5_9GAMM|nr:type I-E CRISPR-associated protein Cas6/Cse3/CasE [Inmirania thermothiophila]ROR32703.1 CRISPR system Cascade subunit CasE [Inmirania thermothiophila]